MQKRYSSKIAEKTTLKFKIARTVSKAKNDI